MADPKDFNNKEFQKEFNETVSVIKDTMVGLSASLNQALVEAMDNAVDRVEERATKTVKTDLTNAFRNVRKEVDSIIGSQDKLIKGQVSIADIQKKRVKLEEKLGQLERAREQAARYGADLTGDQAKDYEYVKEQLEETLSTQEKGVRQLENQLGGLVGIMDRVSKIPIAGEFLNSARASELMKEELIASGSSTKALGKGFKGLFEGISKGTVVLAAIGAAVKALKFVVSLFVQANSQAVDLAKNINTTVASADAVRDRFRDIRRESGQTYNNVTFLIDAMQELVAATGVQRRITEDILKNQTFLTKRVGATAEEATNLNMMFQAFGVNATEGVDKMLALSKAFADTEGIGISINTVLQDINSAGAEIAGYFGFSTEELTKAVITTRRLGVNLSQASSIASNLLDFESSISAELEAELLTGREFNLNLARTLALQGDIAGATSEVLGQMNNLTKEQRRNPIVMKAMADATGLTVEELNKAFLMQSDLNLQAQEYEKIVRSGSEADRKAFIQRYGIDQALREQIESRISLEDQYKEALLDVKQQFVGLVNGGSIDILIDAIKGIANFVNFFTGRSSAERDEDRLQRMEARGDKDSELYKKLKARVEGRKAGTVMDERNIQFGMYAGMQQLNNTSTQTKEIKESTDKQTQVMQELVEQNKQLITAVQTNKDVYLDGNKVTNATAMSLYKSN